MADRILCQQFVYSKFAGASRSASYMTIARSSKITDVDIKKIRNTFNGCRPDSTELSVYKTSYAVSPVGDSDLALLRLDVIEDSESGNKFVLYERYVVVGKEQLREKNLKPWQMLKVIPAPEVIRENKLLEDFTGMEKGSFTMPSYFDDQKKYLANHLFNSLYCLLNSYQVQISFSSDSIDWDWVVLLDMLAPKVCTVGVRLFLGSSKIKDWSPDLDVRFNVRSGQEVNFVAPLNVDLKDLGNGYTNFLWRCFESKENKLLVETLVWAETLDFKTFSNKKSSYDILIKREIPSGLRLELTRVEFAHGNSSVKDLYWLWRNADFDLNDIQKFLPVLLLETLDQWSENDFLILNKYIGLFSPKHIFIILVDEKITNVVRNSFLVKWGQSVENLSPLDIFVWVDLLSYLADKDPEVVFGSLIQFLKFIGLKNFKDVRKIFKSFPESTRLQFSPYFWVFAFWLFSRVKQVEDIEGCIEILSVAKVFKESSVLKDFLNYLLGKRIGRTGVVEEIIEVADYSHVLSAFLPHAINVTLFSGSSDALVFLALSLKDFNIPPVSTYKTNYDAFSPDENVLLQCCKGASVSDDERYISAYVFLLTKLWYREYVKDILSDVLMRDVNLFFRVIEFSMRNLGLTAESLLISLPKLQELKMEDRLRLLIVHFISVAQIDKSFCKPFLIDRLLMNVTSLESVESNILEEFLSFLLINKEWSIARRVLELQTRSAILQKNDVDIQSNLRKLLSVVSRERKPSALDTPRKDMIVSYVRALPVPAQHEFWTWLMCSPLSSTPLLKRAHFQPFTTNLIARHVEWFAVDPYIRYCLFEELSGWK